MKVFRIFEPILSCQRFHSNSFTCCCNLAPYTSWIIKLSTTISDGCPRNWKHDVKDRKMERWQDLSAVVPVINMPEVKSAVKIWLPHPHQYTLIQVKKLLSTYFSWNKRHGTGSLCKPLLQLYTKWGWRGIRAGCQLPGWGVRASDRTEVKE